MDIETGKTPIEQDYISFKNTYNEKITLVANEKALRCAIREDGDTSLHAPFTHFTRDEVKAVLPYLQAYANNGALELQETDIADQGKHIEELQGDLAQAVQHIKKLERYLAIWRDMASETYGDNEDLRPDDFQRLSERTAKLLGEEETE